MARKNFKDLRADLADRVGEERVAEAERAEVELYELEQLALGELRRARSLTQTQLAHALGVTQAQVSRIEHQADLFLSTLASYVEAMGGELDLVATFPDQTSVSLSIGDLAANREEAANFAGIIKTAGDPSQMPDFAATVADELGLPPDAIRTKPAAGTIVGGASSGNRMMKGHSPKSGAIKKRTSAGRAPKHKSS